jgi:hypothetical protein
MWLWTFWRHETMNKIWWATLPFIKRCHENIPKNLAIWIMESVENFLELGIYKLALFSTYKTKPRLIYVIWHWTYKPYVYTWVIISSKKIDFQYKLAYMSTSSICLIFFKSMIVIRFGIWLLLHMWKNIFKSNLPFLEIILNWKYSFTCVFVLARSSKFHCNLLHAWTLSFILIGQIVFVQAMYIFGSKHDICKMLKRLPRFYIKVPWYNIEILS